MPEENPSIQEIVSEFKTFVSNLFPIHCENCGYEVKDLDAFMDLIRARDEAAADFGIPAPSTSDDETSKKTALCECGHPLKIFFEDRRDNTEKGHQFREQFGKVLNRLEKAGVEKEQARQQLMLILHGQDGDLISKIDIETSGNTSRWYRKDKD